MWFFTRVIRSFSIFLVLNVAMMLLPVVLSCSDDATSVPELRYSARSDSTFAVNDASTLEVCNFSGRVIVTRGNPGLTRVVVVKRAARREDLDDIEVEVTGMEDTVRVVTANPLSRNNVQVDVEVTAPADTRPAIQMAAGPITYDGLGEGECQFITAAGTITLKLPADVNVRVLLSVAAGSIRVDFPVTGRVDDHVVDGTIGTGADGTIVAEVGAGQIIVIPQ